MRVVPRSLTADYLREILHYDPLTGIFTWKVHKSNKNALAGEPAGCVNGTGYVYITIDGVKYNAGRLAYLYMQGEHVPADLEIDHHNQIKTDNSWDNLRPLTHQENIAKYHKSIRDAKAAMAAAALRQGMPRWNMNALTQSDNPVDNMCQLLADNADALKFAQLLAERDRRKKIRRKRTRSTNSD